MFFIISGFVITNTLYSTKTIGDFWKKRFFRLFPAMLFCSIITFTLFVFLDDNNIFPNSKNGLNIIYSLTFLNPVIIDYIFQTFKIQSNYICFCYWSLWPEIQFYLLASIIYFINPKRFVIRFSIISVSIYIVNWLFFNIQGSNIFHIPLNIVFINLYNRLFREFFYLPSYILWFLFGVLFYELYNKPFKFKVYPLLFLTFIFQLYSCVQWNVRIIMLVMIVLFMLFIYAPKLLSFLNYKLISNLGIVSYSIYLIHENVGILLINKFSGYLGKFSFLFPLFLIGVFSFFSLFLYKYFEKPINNILRIAFIKYK